MKLVTVCYDLIYDVLKNCRVQSKISILNYILYNN